MILRIGNRLSAQVKDFAEASAVYERARAASGEGGSTFPNGAITEGGRKVATVSYNARVWPPGQWTPEHRPLYDPRKAGVPS